MKTMLLILSLICSVSFAKQLAPQTTADLKQITEQFDNYVKQTSKELEGNVMKDIEDVAALNLNPETDLALVKNVLVTLVKLDKEDPSRSAVMILGPSYGKHTQLFQKAFSELKNQKNKAQLEQFEALMKNFSHLGNG